MQFFSGSLENILATNAARAAADQNWHNDVGAQL